MSHCRDWADVAVAVWALTLAAFCAGSMAAGVTQSVRAKTLHESPLVPVLMVLWIVCAVGVVLAILAPTFFPACLGK
jgi:hypothetical protein